MKILFFTDHFKPEPSAPAAHVFERSKIWSRMGHKVTVICGAPNFPDGKVYSGYQNKWRSIETMDGIRVVRIKTYIAPNKGTIRRIIDYVSYMLSAFVFAMFEEKPDVVISTSPHFFVPIAGVAYSKIKKLPHVFELRDLWPESIASITHMKRGLIYRCLEKIELLLYKHSTRILSFTNSYLENLSTRGVDRNKIDVVINGADLELFHPRERDPNIEKQLALEGRFVVGYLGTIGLAHGLENVLKAAGILKDTNISFLFVGAGASKGGLEIEAKRLNLTNVVFVRRQLREEMPKYWSVCNASLIHLKDRPLFSAVVPSKIFESMAMGIPIVYVGPKGEGSSIVEHHNAGIWVRPEDPYALAESLKCLAESKMRYFTLSANSLSAAKLYSRQSQAEKSFDVLKRAVA